MGRSIQRFLAAYGIHQIPVDWQFSLLDELAERGSGHTPNKRKSEYWDGGIKWVSLADSDKLDQIYIYETAKEISEAGLANSSAVLHPPGMVIVSRDAGVGKSAITASEMAVSQHFIAWKCGPNLDNLFLYYWLQFFKPEFERVAIGSTIKTIGLSYFQKLEIVNPPLPEQRAIAAILSTWDEAITLTEQLIAALQERKRGLMQRLLTGEVRFPEFLGEAWHTVKLGEFTELTAGGTPSTRVPEYWGGNVRWMKSGEIHLRRIHEVENRITQFGLDNSSAKLLPINSVLVALAGQGKTRGTVAINEVELSTNQSVAAIIPNSDQLYYEYLFFNLDSRYEELRRLSTGDGGRGGLNLQILSRIKIPLPPVKEQLHISEVIRHSDIEIQILTRYVAKLIEQKKGLMQRLLTGEIRVQVE